MIVNNEEKYCIYAHINKSNLKVYIGQSKHQDNLRKRWQRNGAGYKRNSYFYKAICKYGWDEGFEHIILEENLTANQADFYERMYIDTYNSTNPNYGYNHDSGGNSNKSLSIETKLKISNANKGKCYSEETKRKIREGTSKNKSVYCLELDTVFISATEASRQLGVSWSNIAACCRGDRKGAGEHPQTKERLHWCFTNDKENFVVPKRVWEIKPVFCLELNKQFKSAGDAGRQMNIRHSHISECCRGKRKSEGKHPETNEPLHWVYA